MIHLLLSHRQSLLKLHQLMHHESQYHLPILRTTSTTEHLDTFPIQISHSKCVQIKLLLVLQIRSSQQQDLSSILNDPLLSSLNINLKIIQLQLLHHTNKLRSDLVVKIFYLIHLLHKSNQSLPTFSSYHSFRNPYLYHFLVSSLLTDLKTLRSEEHTSELQSRG